MRIRSPFDWLRYMTLMNEFAMYVTWLKEAAMPVLTRIYVR
jgi:hypothetical protein